MTLKVGYPALLALALAAAQALAAPRVQADLQFGVIGHSFARKGGEQQLEQSLSKVGSGELAFAVATGIKAAGEPCSDTLYAQRRLQFAGAPLPLIVMPAASDWSDCKNSAGRPAGNERLNRLREVFYTDAASLGEKPLALARQSANAKFRSYAENAYWTVGNVLYATINIPSNNNHYRSEAGRNSEFEDRAVANRFWLNRLFALAKRKQLAALVLFSEGNVKILSDEPGLLARLGRSTSTQDGYAAPRHQIVTLAAQFGGKVLLIDTGAVANGTEPAIAWRSNLGHVSIGSRAVIVHVTPKADTLFRLEQP